MTKSDAMIQCNPSASIRMHVAATYARQGHFDNHILQSAGRTMEMHMRLACKQAQLATCQQRLLPDIQEDVLTPGSCILGFGLRDTFMVRGP